MHATSTIQVLYGAEGIKQVYRDSLLETELDIVCLATDYQAVLGDFFDGEYAPKLHKKVKTRELLADTPGNRADAKSKDGHRNAVRLLPKAIASESDMLLSADRVVLISYGKESPMAIIITDVELINSFRSQFETLWANLG